MNELYGSIAISKNGDNLLVKFYTHSNINLTATLQYMDNDEWLLTYSHPAFGIFAVKFAEKNAKVEAIDIKVNDFIEYDSYTFLKQ